MAKEKRTLPVGFRQAPKERQRKAQRSQYDPKAAVPDGLEARLPIPKSKHHTYFEFVENPGKKKKLEYQITTDKLPPPGFEFVPIGNPELTTACKDISRETGALIFIVSNAKGPSNHLSHQIHRIGHHIRQTIVEEAKSRLTQAPGDLEAPIHGQPEPIPESQAVYNSQADAAIRDLFPRIPNTDRQQIIEHAFSLNPSSKGERPVGLSADITLARRVQLAVLAHIRHIHTRYDDLLKETSWQVARKAVETLCLDILVKWRGDEETGRDQLDEILREVVIISDSEDGDVVLSEDESADSSVEEIEPPTHLSNRRVMTRENKRVGLNLTSNTIFRSERYGASADNQSARERPLVAKSIGKQEQRGFKRYRAWQDALERNRESGFGWPAPPHVDQSRLRTSPLPALTSSSRPPERDLDWERNYRPRGFGYDGTHDGSASALAAEPQLQNTSRVPPLQTAVRAAEDRRTPLNYAARQLQERDNHSRSASPISKRFQDLLMPSIERDSPDPCMEPAFIRPVRSRTRLAELHSAEQDNPYEVCHAEGRGRVLRRHEAFEVSWHERHHMSSQDYGLDRPLDHSASTFSGNEPRSANTFPAAGAFQCRYTQSAVPEQEAYLGYPNLPRVETNQRYAFAEDKGGFSIPLPGPPGVPWDNNSNPRHITLEEQRFLEQEAQVVIKPMWRPAPLGQNLSRPRRDRTPVQAYSHGSSEANRQASVHARVMPTTADNDGVWVGVPYLRATSYHENDPNYTGPFDPAHRASLDSLRAENTTWIRRHR